MNLRFLNRLQRHPDPADNSGGGDAGFSLKDLEDDESTDDNKSDDDDDSDDDSDKKPKEPTPEEIEQKRKDDEKLALEKGKKDKQDEPEPKDKDDEPSDNDSEPEEFIDAEEYVAELVALGAPEVAVDYGDVDPLSAQGEILRQEAVADFRLQEFEAHLEANFPKAYGFLLHQMAGKPEDEFFGKGTDLEVLPSVEQLEASVEVQKEVITADLIAKGNSEKYATIILNQMITDGDLEENAKVALAAREKAQNDSIAKLKEDNDKAIADKETAISKMTAYVDDVVNTGKIGNISIPEKDRVPFAKAFKDKIRLENGNFVIVTPVTNDNINQVFGKEFFDFKNGDLGKLVETAAKTVNATRLKRTIPKQTTPKGGKEDQTRIVTLGEMDAD